jgi:hypothetical protein
MAFADWRIASSSNAAALRRWGLLARSMPKQPGRSDKQRDKEPGQGHDLRRPALRGAQPEDHRDHPSTNNAVARRQKLSGSSTGGAAFRPLGCPFSGCAGWI